MTQNRRSSVLPWVVPVLAMAAAAVFAWQAVSQRGPRVLVQFADGAGIAAGDPVSFRGVRVGDVKAVRLTDDMKHVEVEARLRRDAKGLAVEGSRWWIVRPEISAGRVSGLDALLGPRYLQCEPGSGPVAERFTGLEAAPGGGAGAQTVSGGALEVILEATQRGAAAVDSPVVYRGMRVGSVRSVRLAANAQTVEVVAVIDAEFRGLVRVNSRFWNAGGIGLDWGLIRGLSVKGSLESVLAGAVAFATPTKPGETVENGRRFPLADEAKSDWLEWSPLIELGPK